LGAACRHLHADAGVLSASRHARGEIELGACSIVLDLLALALIDRSDVQALTTAGVRAHRALREAAVAADAHSVRALDAPSHRPERERRRHDEYLDVALRAGASTHS
jgi:hypothetical protein